MIFSAWMGSQAKHRGRVLVAGIAPAPGMLANVVVFVLMALAAGAMLHNRDIGDDAYITARYAENLAHGHGWVWNVGMFPTDGTTAPLWTIILAGVVLTNLPFVPAVLALNTALFGLMTLFGWHLVRRLSTPFAPLVYLALAAVTTVFLHRCEGMETVLYSALVLGGLAAWQHDRPRLALVCAAVLPLVRGDGLLFLVALCAVAVWQRRFRRLALGFTVACLPLAAWELFSLVTFHALLPTSFLAKHAQTPDVSGKVTWASFLSQAWPIAGSVWVVVVALCCLWVCRRQEAVRLVALWAAIYTIFYSFAANVPEQSWYILPAWWSMMPVIAAGIGVAAAQFREGRGLATKLPLVVLMPFLIVGLWPMPGFLGEALTTSAPRLTQFYAAARYLNHHPPGLVATAEIGTVGFYSHDPIVDLLGLVSPEVVSHLARHDYAWAVVHEHPRYLLLWGSSVRLGARCGADLSCIVQNTPYVRLHYRLVRHWIRPAAYSLFSYVR